jgi:hypothetical protein
MEAGKQKTEQLLGSNSAFQKRPAHSPWPGRFLNFTYGTSFSGCQFKIPGSERILGQGKLVKLVSPELA